MSNEKILEDMTRDILEMKREIERLSKLSPLYEIISREGSVDLTADANNFALPNVDFIYPNPTTNRIIHGFIGGVTGRKLYVYNRSNSFTLSFPHASASADVGNKLITPTSGTIVLATRRTALFVYGESVWWMLFPAA